MSEIEEIRKRIISRGYIGYEESLLSSLEKEEQAHTMSVFDLNMKIAELGIALEKEKERISEAEFLRDGMQTRCGELFVENEKLKETINFWKNSYLDRV